MTTRRSTRRGSGTARDYPRTARLNELLREILADELERIDDDRLPLATVVSVEVEPDLRRATVFYDNLDGPEGDEETLEALGEVRVRLQAAIGRQARVKRTPELTFRPDPSVRSGERIDELLRDIEPRAEGEG
jgi:ribosome-binding factor A